MISLRRVQTTQTPRARRLAANCLIFSDVKEMRDGFSQHLIIPMNSVTIPIWPRASDRNGRRSWWCSWKLELIDRVGKRPLPATNGPPCLPCRVAHFAYHLEKKACIRRRSVKSRDWVLEQCRAELGCLGHSLGAVRGLLSTLPVGSGAH